MSQSRRNRRAERARQDILDAAARVFSRAGYRGATMAEIAREADYTPPTLYSYFKKKLDIAESLIAASMSIFEGPLREPVPDGLSLRARLTLVLRGFDRIIEDHHDAVHAIFRLHAEGIGLDGLPQIHALFLEGMTEWFRTHSRPEEARFPPEVLACVLFGISQGYEVQWRARMAECDPDCDPDTMTSPLKGKSQEILDIFFHGVAP